MSRMTLRKGWCVALGQLMLISFAACLVCLPSATATVSSPPVQVWETTADLSKTLARMPSAAFRPGTVSTVDSINVNPASRFQTITAGFGLAMTDTSAYELARQLPEASRNAVMAKLFSPTSGIGLSFLRIPIGGSDYNVGNPYTYDDLPAGETDPTLVHFSTRHDNSYTFPIVRAALALNRHMTVMANPWTPPAWMKTDDQLITRTGTLGHLKREYFGAYANYLVKTLKSYASHGVHVNLLGVQNEPLTPELLFTGIPESYLSPQDEGTLIHSFVEPALRRAGLNPGIMAVDDRYSNAGLYAPPVIAGAGRDIAGIALHCYMSDPSAMTELHNRYPAKELLVTECASKLSNVYPAQMSIRALRNYAEGIQLWGVASDQDGGPKVGLGCMGLTPPFLGQPCSSPITVNTTTHTYTLTSDFWALAQFSKFIKIGAQRIGSSTPASCKTDLLTGYICGLEDVAFRNPDGSEVIVATAHDGKAHTAVVNQGGRHLTFNVPDGATVTVVLGSSA